MGIDDNQTHRPGIWKQKNKAHKSGRHRTAREVDAANKGRVAPKVISRKAKRKLTRRGRKCQMRDKRRNKLLATLVRKRSLGCAESPPFLVAIIPLSASTNPYAALNVLKSCDDNAIITTSQRKCCHISLPRFKQRYSFFIPPPGDLHAILDAAKVADTLMFLYDVDSEINDHAELILSAVFYQGLPTTIHVIQGLSEVASKRRNVARMNIQRLVEERFPKEKLISLDNNQDAILVLRQIGSQKQQNLVYRDRRAHLFCEEVVFEPNENEPSEGTLKVSGYVRGKNLDVNDLIHIPGWSDFQISQIIAPEDPHPLNLFHNVTKRKSNNESNSTAEKMEGSIKVLGICDPSKQPSLESENAPDPMDGEQTWPTEEEIREAEAAIMKPKRIVKRVPKGTSEYQAAWIIDSGDEVSSEEDEDESKSDEEMNEINDVMEEDGSSHGQESEDDEEYEDLVITEGGDEQRYDEEMDADEEMTALKKFKEARMDEMFPDEVDTPMNIPARIRFQKYRGLESFRTSPWDPKENLPLDYARIFQFENFARSKKRVFAEVDGVAKVGVYVTLHIAHAPRHFYDSMSPLAPLIVYKLLSYEQRMSVINVVIKRLQDDEEEVIESKEKLIFHIGCRRFCAAPVFSQHTNGTRHKYERFWRPNSLVVATMYAPITFPPSSVLVFKEQHDGTLKILGGGSLLSCNPDRIIAKRIVLSGHPFRINRKSATVRYMFFNKEDIKWFKPVKLRTKCGRKGHIKDSLGTHGHMKCVFDAQLKSQDAVLMNLYKRVFPKWVYDPYVPSASPSSDNTIADMVLD